jgi:hypothetical protein
MVVMTSSAQERELTMRPMAFDSPSTALIARE